MGRARRRASEHRAHAQRLKVYGDVFSCKEFNLKTAMDLATKNFGLDRVRHRRLERGWVNAA